MDKEAYKIFRHVYTEKSNLDEILSLLKEAMPQDERFAPIYEYTPVEVNLSEIINETGKIEDTIRLLNSGRAYSKLVVLRNDLLPDSLEMATEKIDSEELRKEFLGVVIANTTVI